MPTLRKPPEEALLGRTMLIIRQAGLSCGLRTDADIADRCGIPRSTFWTHAKNGGWSWKNMATMVRVLHIKSDDAAQMLGAKKERAS